MPLDWVNKQNDVDFILAEDVNALATAIIENENQIENKQDKLIFDDTPTSDSTNPVTSAGIKAALDEKANIVDVYNKSETYTKTETDTAINNKLSSIYKFMGSVGDLEWITNLGSISTSPTRVYNYTGEKITITQPYNGIPYLIHVLSIGTEPTEDGGTVGYFVVNSDEGIIFYEGLEIKLNGSTPETITKIKYNVDGSSNSNGTARIYIEDYHNLPDTLSHVTCSPTLELNPGDNFALIMVADNVFIDKLSGTMDLSGYQIKLTFDEIPTVDSINPVTSRGINIALDFLKSKSIPHTIVSGYPITITDHLAGEELLSCRVYGADGGVGDLVSDGEYSGKYALPVYIRGKNLIDVSAFANIDNYFNAKEGRGGLEFFNVRFPAGTYTASVNIINTPTAVISAAYVQDNTIYPIKVIVNTTDTQGEKSVTFTAPQDWYIRLYYGGSSNTVARLSALMACIDSLQLEYGSSATEYEEYTEPYIVTAYLDAPLTAGQSAEVSGLKAIDSDVNTITAETTVKPSKIEVEYYQDINKVITNLTNSILSQGGNV